jgi:hypothetical protein
MALLGNKIVIFMILVLVGIALAVWAIGASGQIDASKLDPSTFGKTFGLLILMALFVERATEVLVNMRRGEGRAQIDASVQKAQADLDQARQNAEQDATKSGEIQPAIDALAAQEEQLGLFKKQTNVEASIPSVILGLLIALAGVRSIGMFVEISDNIETNQKILLLLVDIYLTGFLIGGGSDGIHKILNAFIKYFNDVPDPYKKR